MGEYQLNQSKTGLIIGCDHGGYSLKKYIRQFLEEQGIPVEDVGSHNRKSVNYPVYGKIVSEAVSSGKFARGILICGTGLGMSMVANRFPRVRAARCTDIFAADMSRRHNNANILVLGGRVTGDILALEIVKTWLDTPFEGGRHQDRIDMIEALVAG